MNELINQLINASSLPSPIQSGRLLRIPNLKPWSLMEVLTQKYDWHHTEARNFVDFLRPMLAFDPDQRVRAAKAQHHSWLSTFSSR